jgi:hypothetical protein
MVEHSLETELELLRQYRHDDLKATRAEVKELLGGCFLGNSQVKVRCMANGNNKL